jgi:F0F1-type ATP synthase epsilon subunit
VSDARLELRVVTPSGELRIGEIVHLRFDALDGSRGVLPGHERSTARLRQGAIYVSVADGDTPRETFVVTEGGMAVIGPREVILVTSWAELAEEMDTLAELVRARAARRARIDAEAKTIGRRHETALRRALIGLKREVSW